MLAASMEQMPSLEVIVQSASNFRLERVDPYWISADPVDLFLYAGKHRPELYLDPTVRSGMSSFANLANETEVSEGLAQLQVDMETGAFGHIRASYDSVQGDYSFITLWRV